MLGVLLGFIPILVNCANSQHVLSADSKLKNKNEYYPVFLYSEENKQGYVGLGLASDRDGMSGMMVFSAMVYEDKKNLFAQYKTPHDRIVSAPRNKASILLTDKRFVDIFASRNVRDILMNFPYIASDMKFTEQIGSQNNEMIIRLDKKIKYSTEKDARKNRLDWISMDTFSKKNDQTYPDQAQLKVSKGDINSLDFRGGCLSSEDKGKIKNVAVFMTEIGTEAKIKDLKVIELEFADPVFHTFFISEVNIKLKKKTIVPLYKQHDFKLVCTTTKGIQLSAHDSFISTMKPRHFEY